MALEEEPKAAGSKRLPIAVATAVDAASSGMAARTSILAAFAEPGVNERKGVEHTVKNE
jgi:hypothetical protein